MSATPFDDITEEPLIVKTEKTSATPTSSQAPNEETNSKPTNDDGKKNLKPAVVVSESATAGPSTAAPGGPTGPSVSMDKTDPVVNEEQEVERRKLQ